MQDRNTRSLEEFLEQLAQRDVILRVENGQLKYSAPKGVVQGDLREELLQRKEELLARLSASAAPVQNGPLEASFHQEMLWSLDRLSTDAPSLYIEARAVRVHGDLSPITLKAAADELLSRHAILRTHLELGQEGLSQVIAPTLAMELPVEDLRQASAEAIDVRVNAIAWKGFDLGCAPLLRMALLRCADDEWILIISQHHVITDRWSVGILIRELGALYQAFSAGMPSPLPYPKAQYADYSRWQRANLGKERLASLLAWWKESLSPSPPRMALPTDRPYPLWQSYRGARLWQKIDPALWRGVEQLARTTGTTPFMVLLSSFSVLLHRYTRDEAITIGTPIANRLRPEFESVPGFFVNTLALCTPLTGSMSFRSVLKETSVRTAGAYEHQELPFSLLVEALQPDRNLNHPPVFQVMMVLQNVEVGTLVLGDLVLSNYPLREATAKYPLMLTLLPDEADGPQCFWEYQTDLFDAATIERLNGHFVRLLASALADPDQPVSQLALLSENERRLLLETVNRTEHAYPGHAGIAELFAEQALLHPTHPALRYRDFSLSYRDLDRASDRLAARLASRGVQPGDFVGIALPRSPEFIIGILSILKAGGAYVPFDLSYPTERLSFLAEDSGIRFLITDQAGSQSIAWSRLPCILVDGEEGGLPEETDYVPWRAGPESPAYLMYTSGSTGLPKGVVIPQRGVVRLVKGADYACFDEHQVFLMLAPVAFDASTLEIWVPLLNGGTLVIAPPLDGNLSELGRILNEGEVTTLWLTSGLFSALVDCDLNAFGGLRQLLAGGDALSLSHVNAFLHRHPQVKLINGYGPTENTTFTCCHVFPSHPVDWIPIGRPIANTRVYILDGTGAPVPLGVPGELHAGGDGLALAYHQRPELNETQFVDRDFRIAERTWTERLYRTGDLARWVINPEDGKPLIEFLGRIDSQVKIRGFRVEPGEIEAQLERQPEIAAAVVVARREVEDTRLVAFYVPSGETPTEDFLKLSLSRHLPTWMIPERFIPLTELPVTANGKVERSKLATMPLASAKPSNQAPETPLERLLAPVWAGILGQETIGREDNFFHLGGHSLSAIRLAGRIETALSAEGRNISVPVRLLFEHPTLSAFAAAVGKLEQQVNTDPILPRPAGSDLQSRPLSLAQERVWILEKMLPLGGSYNVPGAWRLHGTIDPGRLERALQAVIRRHAVLQASFHEENGEARQRFDAMQPFRLATESCTEDEFGARILADAERRFDLEGGAPVRALLLTGSPYSHCLLLVMHHLVCDGWSVEIFLREVEAIYSFRTLPELPFQYADYAEWQRRSLTGEHLEALVSWWRKQLAGLPDALDLPTDFPRPATARSRGATLSFPISVPGIDASIERLCQEQGASRFMFAYAAFSVLLWRYSGQEDFAVGTPVAGRHPASVEPLIGFFADNLVLRTLLKPDEAFSTLLTRTRQTVLEALDHQELPFTLLVDALKPVRRLGAPPLFQVMLVVEDNTAFNLSLPGIEARPVPVELPVAKYDLTLSLCSSEDGLYGRVEYDTDLFRPESMALLGRHFSALLGAIVANPATPVGELDLRSAGERARLPGLSGAICSCEDSRGLPGLITAQAARTPAAIAISAGEETLSYAELEQQSDRLARRFVEAGVTRGARIAVWRHRSLNLPVILLAVLKAGAAWVPLNPRHPLERLRSIVEKAGPQLLVVDSRTRDLSLGVAIPTLFPEGDGIAEGDAEAPGIAVTSDLPAYILFTSGSTGQPKGVVIPHRALCNHLSWFIANFGTGPDTALLQMTAFDFDASVIELFAPFLVGGRVVMTETGSEQDTAVLQALIRRERISVFQAVPSLLQVMLDEGHLRDCPSLTALCSGGEALPVPMMNRLIEQVAPTRVFNLYGPTEACIDAAWWPCRTLSGQGTAPIGGPVDNLRLYVLDERLRPLPAGIAGELFIAGRGLADGYVGEDELTRLAFLPDPFAAMPGERMYRSGDRVRLGPDGIELLGRIDEQVKVRGFRIETSEIEGAILAAAPELRGCAVVAAAAAGGQRLVACLMTAPSPSAKTLENNLRLTLKQTLPDYMVPAHFLCLDALPLLSNGKTDRRRLAALAAAALAGLKAESAGVAPRNSIERQLADIWQAVLNLPSVGIHESFFERGGNSLLAIRVISRIRSTWPVEITVRSLFEAPTVAELALRIDSADLALQRPPLVALPRLGDGHVDRFPLSWSQRSLWFLDQLEGGSRAYTTISALEFRGALDLEALRMALASLISRHEPLRTRFVVVDNEPWQQVEADLPLPFSQGRADAGANLETLALEELARPIHLADDAPLRFRLLELAKDHHLGILTWHHIASDGWSLDIFVREFCALYREAAGGKSASLQPLPLHYGDYAAWQRAWFASPDFANQCAWWKEALRDAPLVLPLCTDRPRPHRQRFRGATLPFAIDAGLRVRLEILGRQNDASLYMVLLAAFLILLKRYSRQDDILVGTPVANRPMRELEGLIGFFTNTVVMRGRLDGAPTLPDFLTRVRQMTLDAFAHQDVPFEKVVDVIDPPRSLSHSPLFQVMFNLQNTPMPAIDLPGLSVTPLSIDTQTAKFDLLVSLIDGGGALDGHWEYDADLFDASSASRMASQYVHLLESIAQSPTAGIETYDLLDATERANLIALSRGPTLSGSGDGLLHALLNPSFAQCPDAIAIECGSTSLSYAQLERWSNGLAHQLIGAGVGLESPVGLWADRSLEMAVAVLAILKAGGCYVPLDPMLPEARLAFMMADAGVTQVLGKSIARPTVLPATVAYLTITMTEAAEAPQVALNPEHLAYILYTSGSTGQPKGVAMPHRALHNLISWQLAETGFSRGLRTLQFTTLGFDVATQELFSTWASGGTLLLIDEALRKDIPALLDFVATHAVQRLFLPFTALQQMAEALPLAAAKPKALREIITAGERLKVTPALRRLFEALPGCRLSNQYGPTETHVVTAYALPEDPLAWPELPSIGSPVANVSIHILDSNLSPLPPGVPGQLWVGGSALSRGYVGRSEENARRYAADPFDGGRLYATGDLACLRLAGLSSKPQYDFLGRIDQQIKLRGYRVEPEEVERALLATGLANAAAVVARADAHGENRLLAYYVPASQETTSQTLRQALSNRIPEYMLPSFWIPLATLPQTRTGKIDRKALPEPDFKAEAPVSAAPETPTETIIAGLWKELLEGRSIGRNDNFFDLGGSSLLLVRLLADLRRRFPAAGKISMVHLFDNPTVQSLARLLDEAAGKQSPESAPPALEGRAAIRASRQTTVQDLRARRRSQS